MAVHNRTRKAVLTGKRKRPRCCIEQRTAIPSVNRLRIQLIAKAEVDRQLPAHLPVILNICSEVQLTHPGPIEQLRSCYLGRIAKEEVREWRPGICGSR